MSRIRASLRREWRIGRGLAFAQMVLVALLGVAGAVGMPAWQVGSGAFPAWLGFFSVVIVVLTTGPTLITRDLGRSVVRRLPHGLLAPFVAKIIYLLIAALLALAWGWICGEGLRLTVPEKAYRGGTVQQLLEPLALAGAAVVTAFWVMALAAWLRVQMLAVPAAAIALAALGAPIYWWHTQCQFLLPDMKRTFLVVVGVYMLVAGLASGACAFIRGNRFEGARFAPAIAGVPIAILCAVPVWGWMDARYDAWKNISPLDPGVQMSVYLGADERYAYANIRRPHWKDPNHSTIRIDLQDGSWEPTGGYRTSYRRPPPRFYPGATEALVLYRGEGVSELIDTRTGRVIGVRTPKRPYPADVNARLEETARQRSTWQLPDGTRIWSTNGTLYAGDGDQPRVLATGGHTWQSSPVPPRIWRASGRRDGFNFNEVFDPYREEVVEWPPAAARRAKLVAIRRGPWIMSVPKHSRDHSRTFWFWDPATGEKRPAPGLDRREWVVAVLPDDRLVLNSKGGPVLYDPELGTRTQIDLGPTSDPRPGNLWVASAPCMVGALRCCVFTGTRRWQALLHPDGTVSVARGASMSHIGHSLSLPREDGSVVFLADGNRIVRAWYGSDRVEVLFPRP